MKRSNWLTVSVVSVVFAYWLWVVLPVEEEKKVDVSNVKALLSKNSNDISHADIKENVQSAQESANTQNPYENEALKAQIQQVADIYAENIKYPVTSQPIYNPDDVREYKPFEQSEVDLPFPEDDSDENPIRISAATDRFLYFQGDTILIRVKVSGAPSGVVVQVNGVFSSSNGDIPTKPVFETNNQDQTEFTASFDTRLAPSNRLTPEMLVKLSVVVGNRDLSTSVPFRYTIASAQVVGVQQARPEGAELVIPLLLNVFQAGYYFVNGVLEEAGSGRPLIQLQAESRLPQGSGVINLKAHIAALKRQGSQGPYILRNIQAYRGAGVGESLDVPASSLQSQFTINGFPFSAYEDKAFVDELAKERLEYLRKLGAVEGEMQEQ